MKKVIHQIDSKNKWLLLSANFTAKFVLAEADGRCSVEKVFSEISQNSQEKTLAQVFSCEFGEISKNTFFTEYLRTTASVQWNFLQKQFATLVKSH